jgi:hypothetical protein
LSKIDKARINNHENGGKYYNFVLIERKEPGKFGETHIVVESVTKEERSQGIKGKIVGNATDRDKKPPAKQHGGDSEAPF